MGSQKHTYRLINPLIEGSVNTVVKARNSFSVEKKYIMNYLNILQIKLIIFL